MTGHGEYGEVFLAKAKGIVDSESEVVVMVKALQTRDENAHFEYKREMDMLNKLRHENIAKLLGMCRESEPFLFITEYSDWVRHNDFLYLYYFDSIIFMGKEIKQVGMGEKRSRLNCQPSTS